MRIINSFWTIIIVILSISVPALAFFFTHSYNPVRLETRYLNDLADQQEQQANQMGTAKKNVQKAIDMVNQKTQIWDNYVLTRTPPTSTATGGIDLSVSPLKLVTDTYTFRDSIQKAVNTQVKHGGVTVLDPAPYVQATIDPNYTGNLLSGFYHYPDYPFPVVIFDFGTVRVQGTYAQIIENVKGYKTMPHYLAVTDGLRIDGTSPNLTGTYQLSIVGFIRAKSIAGSIPEAAGTGSSGAANNPFGGGGNPFAGAGGNPFAGPGGPGGPGVRGRPGGGAFGGGGK